jgi:hypothetical protein
VKTHSTSVPSPLLPRVLPRALAGALLLLATTTAACATSISTDPNSGAGDDAGAVGDAGNKGASSDAAGSIDIDSYYAQTYVQGCQKAFDCCTATGDDAIIANNWKGTVTTRAGCAQAAGPGVLHDDLAERKKEIADGTSIYHGDAAQACLDAKGQASCTGYFDTPDEQLPAACQTIFEGTLALHAACTLSGQCAGAAACIGNPNTGYTCQTVPSLGEACAGYCPTGLYCDLTAASPTCKSQLPEGSPCDTSILLECQSDCDYTTLKCAAPFSPACVGP